MSLGVTIDTTLPVVFVHSSMDRGYSPTSKYHFRVGNHALSLRQDCPTFNIDPVLKSVGLKSALRLSPIINTRLLVRSLHSATIKTHIWSAPGYPFQEDILPLLFPEWIKIISGTNSMLLNAQHLIWNLNPLVHSLKTSSQKFRYRIFTPKYTTFLPSKNQITKFHAFIIISPFPWNFASISHTNITNITRVRCEHSIFMINRIILLNIQKRCSNKNFSQQCKTTQQIRFVYIFRECKSKAKNRLASHAQFSAAFSFA